MEVKRMVRLHPKSIKNAAFLSRLLEYYIATLENSPFQLSLRSLAWDTQIPEAVWVRLTQYYRTPEDRYLITISDFHIAFANIMVHYPTVKIWIEETGEVHIGL